MTAKQFYDWCKQHGACEAGLRAIEGKTPAEFWATTKRGDWMEWLCGSHFPGAPDSGYSRVAWIWDEDDLRGMPYAQRRRKLMAVARAANEIREEFGNPFLKTRKRKAEVA